MLTKRVETVLGDFVLFYRSSYSNGDTLSCLSVKNAQLSGLLIDAGLIVSINMSTEFNSLVRFLL